MSCTYVMRKALLTRFKNQGVNLHCRKCGMEIQVGDQVVAVRNHTHLTWLYHEKCRDELYIDV